jgi:hypothetical protein
MVGHVVSYLIVTVNMLRDYWKSAIVNLRGAHQNIGECVQHVSN